VGAIFRPQLPPERLPPAVRAAEAAGLDQVWLWEDCFLEGAFSAAGAALASTSTLTIGIGLVPVPLRNVAVTAMEVATLDRMFPGRLVLAVGHGVQDWMGQVGARAASPLELMREYLTALRSLLSGESVSVSGRYVQLDDVQLGWAPESTPQILMGATGPRSLALGGELADAVVLDGLPPEGLGESLRVVQAARAAAGRAVDAEDVAYIRAFTGADAAERLRLELAGAHLPSDAGVAGDAGEVAATVRACRAAGISRVVLQPWAGEDDIESYFGFAAEVARYV
jgi:alkanesulfonate monooxygenase SsuD/methylene tetrahydromethanopterin reductase-like flavin-dependent oxidoreductase (luciferase family)